MSPYAWLDVGGAMQLAKDGEATTILRCFGHDPAKDVAIFTAEQVAAAVAAERERIIGLLHGIDRTDGACKWWDTKEGAAFGAEILAAIRARSTNAPAGDTL